MSGRVTISERVEGSGRCPDQAANIPNIGGGAKVSSKDDLRGTKSDRLDLIQRSGPVNELCYCLFTSSQPSAFDRPNPSERAIP